MAFHPLGAHKGSAELRLAVAFFQGTSVEAIDACENRYKFSRLCDSLRIDQPEWSEFTTTEEAFVRLFNRNE